MKTPPLIDEELLLKTAIQALIEKLGPTETLRFLSLPRKQRLESVKRHQRWQAQLEQKKFGSCVVSLQRRG